MKIAVIGSGYVGLVAGACFADSGTTVVCVDRDERKLAALEKGEVPFYEPRLADIVKKNWPERLTFSSDLASAIDGAKVVFIAVGTPPQEDGSADLSHVLTVAEQVAKAAKHDLVLVTKSTVPVGTNMRVRQVVQKHTTHKIDVVSNPEFLKEGDAVNDFFKPDRIVIGTDSDHAFEVMARLYAPFNRQQNRVIRMSPQSAEIVKYAANAMLATKISFMNEIAALCDAAGGDVEQVRTAVGADKRIGYPFLFPGLGFGGSCFPKDLRALVRTGEELGISMDVARAAITANRKPVNLVLQHIERDFDGKLAGKRFALWGLAFKPRTDDVREAPALNLLRELIRRGAEVVGTDPEALHTARAALDQMAVDPNSYRLVPNPYDACKDADALVLCTEWREFASPNVRKLTSLMRGRRVYDGRNVWIPAEFHEAGFSYRGIGRS